MEERFSKCFIFCSLTGENCEKVAAKSSSDLFAAHIVLVGAFDRNGFKSSRNHLFRLKKIKRSDCAKLDSDRPLYDIDRWGGNYSCGNSIELRLSQKSIKYPIQDICILFMESLAQVDKIYEEVKT